MLGQGCLGRYTKWYCTVVLESTLSRSDCKALGWKHHSLSLSAIKCDILSSHCKMYLITLCPDEMVTFLWCNFHLKSKRLTPVSIFNTAFIARSLCISGPVGACFPCLLVLL